MGLRGYPESPDELRSAGSKPAAASAWCTSSTWASCCTGGAPTTNPCTSLRGTCTSCCLCAVAVLLWSTFAHHRRRFTRTLSCSRTASRNSAMARSAAAEAVSAFTSTGSTRPSEDMGLSRSMRVLAPRFIFAFCLRFFVLSVPHHTGSHHTAPTPLSRPSTRAGGKSFHKRER